MNEGNAITMLLIYIYKVYASADFKAQTILLWWALSSNLLQLYHVLFLYMLEMGWGC